MGLLINPELSLDCRSSSKSFDELLAEISRIRAAPEKISKITDYVNTLRDEMNKIDAFKRELPFCMLLLNDAILTMNEELTRCQSAFKEPVLEQFIPLKDNVTESEIAKEKRSWMSSAQLWNSDNNQHSINNKPTLNLDNQLNKKKSTKEDSNQPNVNDLLWSWKNSTGGRAFVPFKACANVVGKEDVVELVGVPGLSLGAPQIKKSFGFTSKSSFNKQGLSLRIPEFKKSNGLSSKSSCGGKPEPSFVVNGKPKPKNGQKQRRRWSPELHRRFLYALQRLGGSKVATPKQIRELMQVDNLTNDEVKSHLQKYRLHNRRIHLSSKTSNAHPGGLWASQGQFGESSKQSNSSGSPHGPFHIFGSSSGASMTEEDNTEDEEEDEKSESHCWKSQIHLSLKR